MCITLSHATLTHTELYAGEARRGDIDVHVLAYQNRAKTDGPNAMVLPIPAAVLPGPENVIDTRRFRHFLEDIQLASLRPRRPSLSLGMQSIAGAQVFDVGSYTIVLSESPRSVARALEVVAPERRPALNPDVLDAFEEFYPGWPLALCCWDGDIQAEPLLWWYEPRMPDWLFAPALDGHDGRRPRIDEAVLVDHRLAFGSTRNPTGNRVRYQDSVTSRTGVADLLPKQVHGTALAGRIPNGDFWLPTGALSGPAERRAPGAARGVPVALDGW
jgi:hypothetical protein